MKILVILASYNGEKYIKEQVISILNQNEVEIEIMIFDDFSNDNTIKIIKEFNDNRIKININEVNSGNAALNFLNSARNISFSEYDKYDYIAFSDQDDIWLPNKLKTAIDKMILEDAQLYCSNLVLWNESDNKKHIIKKNYPQKEYDYLFEGGSAGCTYVLKKDFHLNFLNYIEKINFNTWNNLSHDWLIYFIARVNNFKVVIDSNSLILYRIHSNNVHGQLNKKTLSAYFKKFKMVNEGWYFNQLLHFRQFIPLKSEMSNIYDLYSKNWFSRLYVLLRYNFKLIRSNGKFFNFFLISLLPRQQK